MHRFEFMTADRSAGNYTETMEEIYRLRFKVYCEEWGFEEADNYPDGMERNEYDDVSEHFYIRCKEDGVIIGTARIIMPSGLGYPIRKHCSIDREMEAKALGTEAGKRIGEVSRLAISREFRKRIEDNLTAGYVASRLPKGVVENRNRKRDYVFEFYKYLLNQSKENLELTHWYAAMRRSLYVLLKRIGMVFHPIGPEVEYHGRRTPYLGSIDEIMAGMNKKNPSSFLIRPRQAFAGNGPSAERHSPPET